MLRWQSSPNRPTTDDRLASIELALEELALEELKCTFEVLPASQCSSLIKGGCPNSYETKKHGKDRKVVMELYGFPCQHIKTELTDNGTTRSRSRTKYSATTTKRK